jgi:hypothetical protein
LPLRFGVGDAHEVGTALVRDDALTIDHDRAIEGACDQIREVFSSHDHRASVPRLRNTPDRRIAGN